MKQNSNDHLQQESQPPQNPPSFKKRIQTQFSLALCGLLIGAAAILPGISGGVLAVVFGVYEPLMALFAHPLRNLTSFLKRYFILLVFWLLGFLVFAKVLDVFFTNSSVLATWLVIGLIAGELPSLFQHAGRQGRNALCWVVFILGLVFIYLSLRLVDLLADVHIEPNPGWFFFCGALWGLSLIVPGMTSSSILIYLDLFQPMTAGVASLDPGTIFPMGAGILLTALMLAKLVHFLFQHHNAVAWHAILGITIASTIAIIPLEYNSLLEGIGCAVLFVAGFALAKAMDRLGEKTSAA